MRTPDRIRNVGHEDRILDRPTPLAVPHIHDDDTVTPFGRVGDPIVYPHVVDPAVRVIVFTDVLGVVDIADVENDVLVAGRQREEIVVGSEHVVHAARKTIVVG